ncbi:MAG: hypothetical protein WC975_04965 [Phycisphaerae bacterium]
MSWIAYSADFVLGNKTGLRARYFAVLSMAVILIFVRGVMAEPVATPSSRPVERDKYAILETVPAEAVAAYASFDTSSGIDAGTGQMITSLLGMGSVVGFFNANQQILVDIVSSLVAIGKYPHAVFMLDVSARKLGEGSFTLNSLSLGVVVRAPAGEHGKFLTLLKQIIDHYFNQDDARLIWVGEGAMRHQKMDSSKFPNWCCWEWGSMKDTFIFTIGPGAYSKVFNTIAAKEKSISSVEIVGVTKKNDHDMQLPFLMLYLNLDSLSGKLRPVMEKTYDDVVDSFSANNLHQFIYSAGFTKRAYISKMYMQQSDKSELGYLTGDFVKGDPRAKAVPPQTNSYGVGSTNISKAVRYGAETYLASRNPVRREKLIENYDKLAAESGSTNGHEFLMSHFGPAAMVIVHDWPKHPFNLPIAKTLLIQHNDSRDFKTGAEKILRIWQMMLRAMSGTGKEGKVTSAWESLFDLQLDRTPEGIWFLHLGPVILVAAGLDDHFLVLSYSIPAVQMNLRYLKATFGPTTRGSRQ